MAVVNNEEATVNFEEYFEAACEVATQAGRVSTAGILSIS